MLKYKLIKYKKKEYTTTLEPEGEEQLGDTTIVQPAVLHSNKGTAMRGRNLSWIY